MDYLQQLITQFVGPTLPKVIAFGNVLLDHTAKLPDTALLERYKIELGTKGELSAETLSKITAEANASLECVTNPGGSALNTVRILKYLGTDTLFLGAVGDDDAAAELRNILKERGVEARLPVVSGAQTGQCICLVHGDSTALYANIGASAKFTIEDLKETEADNTLPFLRPIERKQILYIEGFFVPQREQVCEFIITNYIHQRRRLALNLSADYIVRENYEQVLSLARRATFIFGNQIEFQALMEQMNCKSLEEMARTLLQEIEDAKIIVITNGAAGVQVITNYESELAKPNADISFQMYNVPRVENLVDTTGAGDAFVAGFLHAWLKKCAVSECVRAASDLSAIVCTQIGCNVPETVYLKSSNKLSEENIEESFCIV